MVENERNAIGCPWLRIIELLSLQNAGKSKRREGEKQTGGVPASTASPCHPTTGRAGHHGPTVVVAVLVSFRLASSLALPNPWYLLRTVCS